MSYEHYSRVYSSIWAEPWTENMRTLAFYLVTGPQRRTEGLYRLPLAYVEGDLDWQPKRLKAVLGALTAEGFVEHDPKAQLVLLVNALKRNGLNTKQRIGVVKAFRELPPSPLLERFVSLSREFNQQLWEDLAEAFPSIVESLAN